MLLCCAVLCCAVLRCAVLCCAVLRCAVLCCAACAVLCCAVLRLSSGDTFMCDSLYRLLVRVPCIPSIQPDISMYSCYPALPCHFSAVRECIAYPPVYILRSYLSPELTLFAVDVQDQAPATS